MDTDASQKGNDLTTQHTQTSKKVAHAANLHVASPMLFVFSNGTSRGNFDDPSHDASSLAGPSTASVPPRPHSPQPLNQVRKLETIDMTGVNHALLDNENISSSLKPPLTFEGKDNMTSLQTFRSYSSTSVSASALALKELALAPIAKMTDRKGSIRSNTSSPFSSSIIYLDSTQVTHSCGKVVDLTHSPTPSPPKPTLEEKKRAAQERLEATKKKREEEKRRKKDEAEREAGMRLLHAYGHVKPPLSRETRQRKQQHLPSEVVTSAEDKGWEGKWQMSAMEREEGLHRSSDSGHVQHPNPQVQENEIKDSNIIFGDVPCGDHWQPDPSCSAEQYEVLRLVNSGRNVFFTGSAGVGKSFLLQEIKNMLKAQHQRNPYRNYVVTAPTGIAAVNIGGRTIHSFAGIGLGNKPVAELVEIIQNSRKKKKDWQDCKVWIIDEISMCEPDLFIKLDIIGQILKMNTLPFGGIQMILAGDFFQLPPVQTCDHCLRCYSNKFVIVPSGMFKHCLECGLVKRSYTYCFETPTWNNLNLITTQLTKVFRQSDEDFIRVLNKIRWGTSDQEVLSFIKQCERPLQDLTIKPTKLMPIKRAVERENQSAFAALTTEIFTFKAHDSFRGPQSHNFKSLLNDTPSVKDLELRVGAQVLLTHNLATDSGLVNGSRGVVISFEDVSDGDKELDQPPTLIERWKNESIQAFLNQRKAAVAPKVLFVNGDVRLINPFTWVIELDKENTIGRSQYPLMHAWAVTIHKSQGSSLDSVRIDLSGIFERGQSYVALSRARTKDGMQVANFTSRSVQADPIVKVFYRSISRNQPYDSGVHPELPSFTQFRTWTPLTEEQKNVMINDAARLVTELDHRHAWNPDSFPQLSPNLQIPPIPPCWEDLIHQAVELYAKDPDPSWNRFLKRTREIYEKKFSTSESFQIDAEGFVDRRSGNIPDEEPIVTADDEMDALRELEDEESKCEDTIEIEDDDEMDALREMEQEEENRVLKRSRSSF